MSSRGARRPLQTPRAQKGGGSPPWLCALVLFTFLLCAAWAISQWLATHADHSLPRLAMRASRPTIDAAPPLQRLESASPASADGTGVARSRDGLQQSYSVAALRPWDAVPDPDNPPYLVRHLDRRRNLGQWRSAGTQDRANAVIFTLARNREARGLVRTLQDFEASFNGQWAYPYLFLNDEVFSSRFIGAMQGLSSKASMTFGKVPPEHWGFPAWINQTRAAETRQQMEADGVRYGGSVSYRFMCRYNSGFFFRHPLAAPYKYYWRVEPDVVFPCKLQFDPFLRMQELGKRYAFVINILEISETVPTLWSETVKFAGAHDTNQAHMAMFERGGRYTGCHYWSNFEIADMDFFRSEEYLSYFDHLDHAGGFFYERWGDAPVHTLGTALFLKREEVHFFDEIGYWHSPYAHLPLQESARQTCRAEPWPKHAKTVWDGNTYTDCLSQWLLDSYRGVPEPATKS